MTCKDFETVVADLVRDADSAEPEALAHAVACGQCAARLDAERSLSADLRALARSGSAKAAPPALEARLVAAFREAREVAPAPAPAVVPFRRRTVAALATAAAIGAVAAGTLALRAPTAPTAPPAPAPQSVATHPTGQVAPKPVTPGTTAGSRDLPPVLQPNGRGVAAVRTSTAQPPRAASPAPRPEAPIEIVTDFYPLIAASGPAPVEGGQLVRMELPRAQLAALGFQMNVERVDEPITADVLLGHDGVARAIRFVQTSSAASER